MAGFRNILAGGDLIRQKKSILTGWWIFGDKEKWAPYRNLDREVRYFEERMHSAYAAYQAAREDYVVASTNVQMDKDILLMHQMEDSMVFSELPSDESILSRRQGVKYSTSNNQNQKQKGGGNSNGNNGGNQNGGNNGNGGNNNQNQNQNGNQNQQKQQQSQKGKQRTVSVGQLLSAELVLH